MIWTPSRSTPKFKYHQRGIICAAQAFGGAAGPAYSETVTIGTPQTYCVDGTSDNYLDYGYPNTGSSITGYTYTDGSSTTRTVTMILWEEVGQGSCNGGFLYFRLDTTSVPNTDNTFTEIVYGGTTYTRASATYTASIGGDTQWRWSETNGPVSNTTLEIYI